VHEIPGKKPDSPIHLRVTNAGVTVYGRYHSGAFHLLKVPGMGRII
jgi:hypothetical protein